jgi:hypothetical protein
MSCGAILRELSSRARSRRVALNDVGLITPGAAVVYSGGKCLAWPRALSRLSSASA